MTQPGVRGLTRAAILALPDALVVLRPPANGPSAAEIELLLLLTADGQVTAFNGHVDLGTGIGTALAQMVAEELDVALAQVEVVLGDTARTPDQGATIASDTIQNAAEPLKRAAAQARGYLLARAAEMLGVAADQLSTQDGAVVQTANSGKTPYARLLEGTRAHLLLDPAAVTKDPARYELVGRSAPRLDIPAKATGGLTYVHDMRLPGMLHGRVIRPPYAGLDSGPFVGTSLIAVHHESVQGISGLVAVVTQGDFVGVVAEREEQAEQAAAALAITWRPPPPPPDLADLATALRRNPSTPRQLLDKGDVETALAGAATTLRRQYLWPYQMHGSIGPSCALAYGTPDRLTVWSGTQNPHILRADLAHLLEMPEAAIEVIRMEAAGCYGRNCADDVAGDAALLSRAVGRPVRVQLSRAQEHLWEPKGAAQLMEAAGGIDADGAAVAYDFTTRYPSNGAPLLASLLTGRTPPVAQVFEMGDRTCIAPYDYPAMRVVVHDMPPIVRASWLRGVSALPNTFAHESLIDELAAAAGADPVEYRLRLLSDPRGVALVRATAERAGWTARHTPGSEGGEGDVLRGRGFAYARYVHSRFPGYGAAWSAWVADVAVNRRTGEVAVTRVVTGHEAGLMINPDGVRHQIEGNIIQATSRVLKEEVRFEHGLPVSREWGGYPILTFAELPAIDVLMMHRPDQPPLGAGESASVPSAAAIANAVYDATGVRFRELPLTPERIRAGLAMQDGEAGRTPPRRARRWREAAAAALAAGASVFAASAALLSRPAAIAPVPKLAPGVYSAATLERGRILAEAGDCAVCHTAPGGAVNAGGLALQTPFGVVYSTNITPDETAGIGAWSYPAFERAMRQGVHRDGHRLYPAFPYTAYARLFDADIEAIYAYLMSQAPVAAAPPETRLAFPFSLRPLLAGWNLLFHRAAAFAADPDKPAAWNRGAYLVEALGHCSACHSPRNLLGAERGGAARFGGGWAEGWSAPALNQQSAAPVPWTEAALTEYLRSGRSGEHGAASGPMAPVIQGLAHLPDADIRAMAAYLASFIPEAPADGAGLALRLSEAARLRILPASAASRFYDSACAACHESSGALPGAPPVSLALNTSLHAGRPDNLIHTLLHGAVPPYAQGLEVMPGFAGSLIDRQMAELAAYLRARFAPDLPAWRGLGAAIARIRSRTADQHGPALADATTHPPPQPQTAFREAGTGTASQAGRRP